VELGDAPKHSQATTHYVGEGAMQSHAVKLRKAPNVMDMSEMLDHSMTWAMWIQVLHAWLKKPITISMVNKLKIQPN
jgi:hypothetical protein